MVDPGIAKEDVKGTGGTVDEGNTKDTNKDTDATIEKQVSNEGIKDANKKQGENVDVPANEADKQLKSSKLQLLSLTVMA